MTSCKDFYRAGQLKGLKCPKLRKCHKALFLVSNETTTTSNSIIPLYEWSLLVAKEGGK